MAKLAVNLLPPELKEVVDEKNKEQRVTQISIGIVILVILVAGVVLFLKFNQKNELNQANTLLTQLKATLSEQDYKEKEELLAVLQARLQSINTLKNKDAPAFYSYELLTQIVNPGVKISALSVDEKGKADMSIEANDPASLDIFFNSVIGPATTNVDIKDVQVASLSKTSNNYQAELSMNLIVNNERSSTLDKKQ